MKRFLRFALALGCLVASIVVIAYFLAKKYEPEVRSMLTHELNRYLAVPIAVDDINLSLLQRFPFASLRLSNVVVPTPSGGNQTNDTLIFIKDLYFQIGLFDFLKKNYTVTEAEINTGFFNMELYANGRDNYHFWKSSEDSAAGAAFSLNKIRIENFNYSLKTAEHLEMSFWVEKVQGKGDFGLDRFKIEIESKLFVEKILNSGDTLYLNEAIAGDLSLELNQETGQYSFLSSSLEVAEVKFHLSGEYLTDNKIKQWSMAVNTQGADLKRLLHVMPMNAKSRLTAYGAKGKTDLNVKITSGAQLKLDAQFDNLKGVFQNNEQLGSAKINNAKGKLEMRGSISSLFLEELTAQIGSGKMAVWGKIMNFNAPSFDLNVEGKIDLEELKNLLNIELVSELKGEVQMNGRLKGILPRETDNETLALLKGIDFAGKIFLDDGVFQMAGQSQIFDKIVGEVAVKDNAVLIKSITARVNKNPFTISGSIVNALPYISRKGQKLSIKALFESKSLDMNEILSSEETSRDTTYNFSLPSDIAFDLSLNIGEVKFRKFEAEKITGRAYYKAGLLTLNPLQFETANGSVKSKFSIKHLSEGKFAAEAFAQLTAIELESLFDAFENFGQDVVQTKNISGLTDATVSFSTQFDEKLSLAAPSIKANIALSVTDGKLKNLTTFKEIADYLRGNAIWRSLIKVDDFEKKLKDVRFGKLENQIIIENEVVRIPSMTIMSSALTMNISGTHTFENAIDYSFDFLLSEILKTGNNDQSDFGYIVNEGSGARLYMQMGGTVNDPIFSLDRDAAREGRKQKLDKEKNIFKSILKEEFGLFHSDSTLTSPVKEEKKDPRFSVEWKDDPTKKDRVDKKEPRQKQKSDDLFEDDDL